MFELERVTIKADGKSIVREFSGRFEPCTINCIIGPNGAGKSTLLRAIAGISSVDSGTIIYEGKALSALTPQQRARRISYLPQSMQYTPNYSVSLLVQLADHPWHGRWDPKWRAEHLQRCLELCNVDEFRHRDIATLSGGERQRVYLAQVIYQNTPVILLDEPSSFLDLKNIVLIEDILRQIRSEKRAILLVTHDLQTVQRIADRVIAMKRGEIFMNNNPSAVLRPKIIADLFDLGESAVQERLEWHLSEK